MVGPDGHVEAVHVLPEQLDEHYRHGRLVVTVTLGVPPHPLVTVQLLRVLVHMHAQRVQGAREPRAEDHFTHVRVVVHDEKAAVEHDVDVERAGRVVEVVEHRLGRELADHEHVLAAVVGHHQAGRSGLVKQRPQTSGQEPDRGVHPDQDVGVR